MAAPEALSEVSRFPYILKDNRDDDPEDQVTFQLIGLKDRERVIARNALMNGANDDESAVTMADALDVTVALGLKDWENLKKKNKAGDKVEVAWPGTGKRAVHLIGEKIKEELALEIMRVSELGDHDAGN